MSDFTKKAEEAALNVLMYGMKISQHERYIWLQGAYWGREYERDQEAIRVANDLLKNTPREELERDTDLDAFAAGLKDAE